MARNHLIKRYRQCDLELFKIVSRYGHATIDDFRDLKISERRAKDFTRRSCGLLETFKTKQNGKSVVGYRLTRKGKSFVHNRLDIKYPQRSTERTLAHNDALKSKVKAIECTSGKPIKRFFTENELTHLYKDQINEAKRYQEIGVADCMLEFENGERVLVELITSNYTQKTIDGKLSFAALISTEIIMHKAF